MQAVAFNAFDYAEQLKNAGIPEAAAKLFAEAIQHCLESIHKNKEAQERELQKAIEEQRISTQETFEKYDETYSKILATKGDLRETELRLQLEIEKSRSATIKWIAGIGFTLIGLIIALAGLIIKGKDFFG